jgi:hypothetical protein
MTSGVRTVSRALAHFPGSIVVLAAIGLASFQVPLWGQSAVTLVPSMLNMVVGDTHTIQALNAAQQPVTGLTWTSSNPSVVSLSTDDPPVLTAVAVGQATITAGTGSATVTVSLSLSLGTVLWTNPGDGSGVTSIVPAVPSASGVADVFAFQADGTVQAIAADGTTAWTADVSQAWWSWPVPDFLGGLVLPEYNSIVRLDGMTGQPVFVYTPDQAWGLVGPGVGVHTDGTIFAAIQNWGAGSTSTGIPTSVIGIDPTTGTQKFDVPVAVPAGNTLDPRSPYGIMIAGDGYAYFPYAYYECADPVAGPQVNHFMLLRVDSSGAYDNIDVFDWTDAYCNDGEVPFLGPLGMITNADQGILLTWVDVESVESIATHMAVTTGISVSLVGAPGVPGQLMGLQPALQAQDGSFVGTAYVGEEWSPYMVDFDAGGNTHWIVPNDYPQIATADGGVIGQSGTTYDATGMLRARSETSRLTPTPGARSGIYRLADKSRPCNRW